MLGQIREIATSRFARLVHPVQQEELQDAMLVDDAAMAQERRRLLRSPLSDEIRRGYQLGQPRISNSSLDKLAQEMLVA